MNPHFSVQVFYSIWYQCAAVTSLSLIMLYCIWAIFSDRVNDGVFGRLLYAVTAVACAAGLMHMMDGTYPQRATITIFVCVALNCLRRVFIHYFWDSLRRKYFFQLRRLRSQQKAHDKFV